MRSSLLKTFNFFLSLFSPSLIFSSPFGTPSKFSSLFKVSSIFSSLFDVSSIFSSLFNSLSTIFSIPVNKTRKKLYKSSNIFLKKYFLKK